MGLCRLRRTKTLPGGQFETGPPHHLCRTSTWTGAFATRLPLSKLARGAARQGSVAASMVTVKRTRYASLVGVNDDDVFHPMIFEAFGSVAPDTKDALADLLEDVHERLGWASAQLFHREFLRRTADAVQHGMAWVLGRGVLAIRRARRVRLVSPSGPGGA